MSRWSEGIEQSKQYIEQIKNALNEKYPLENASDNTKIEVARARKAIEFVYKCIKIIDPDLTTANFINEINSMLGKILSYIDSAYDMVSINNNIDSLLQKINQYTPIKFIKFSSQDISDMITAYSNTIENSLNEINFPETKNNIEQIKQYKQELLESESSIKYQIDQVKNDIDDKHAAISSIYDELDKENNQSIYNKILDIQKGTQKILEGAIVSNNEITKKLTEATEANEKIDDKLKELGKFYTKIFGQKVVDENGEEIFKNGIDESVNKNLQNMINLYEEFKDKFEELYHIGTNASLASSYETERKSFKCPKIIWTCIAMLCISIMLFIGLCAFKATDDMTFEKLILSMLYKMPIYLPLIWIAVFAMKRRTEAARLEQEYAHKVAIASSYESYKTQIDKLELDDKSKELLQSLMGKTLEIIAKNPSDVINIKTDESSPIFDLIKKYFVQIENDKK